MGRAPPPAHRLGASILRLPHGAPVGGSRALDPRWRPARRSGGGQTGRCARPAQAPRTAAGALAPGGRDRTSRAQTAYSAASVVRTTDPDRGTGHTFGTPSGLRTFCRAKRPPSAWR
eukprot:scaffold909_cov121-Isochrysis_galbana.AAC.9